MENGRMILNSVLNGLLVWSTIVEENGTTRTKKYEEFLVAEKLKADCDLKATNIVLQGDDPVASLNKAMAFLSVVAASRFSLTNNQLRTSSNPRNQDTIQDGRITMQQVQGRQEQSYASTGYKGEGHMARQCTQPKRPRNVAWFKEKAMLAKAQKSGQILDEEKLTFLADPGIPNEQAAQKTIPNTVAFQIEDLDAYDSDCDDVSNAKAWPIFPTTDQALSHRCLILNPIIMIWIIKEAVQDTNLYAQQDSKILSVIEKMSEQMINHVNNWVKANQEKNNESLTTVLERYKERVKNFEQRLNIDLSTLYVLTKPQIFYDDTHKQALSYQNPFYLKKAQRIKPTLYDGSVISSQHVVIPAIDDEETLILEETLKYIFNVSDKDLLNEVTEVQTVFNQMKAVVQQCFEIHKKELLLENY
ncbi:hypothetical protein Tco_0222874 [Tanacetum coccineum]